MTGTKKNSEKYFRAKEMRVKGLSYAEIGSALGVSRQRAQQLVKPAREIYEAVKKRHNSRCADCGVTLKNGHLHHIVNEETVLDYNDMDNLVYLCNKCHWSPRRQAEHGR